MFKVFIVKSWTAPPLTAWRPWLKKELDERGFQASIVSGLPETRETNVSDWVNGIAKAVETPDNETILVGHSLGCISILKYLETISTPIAGCVFVAGFAESVGFKEHASFFDKSLDWKTIRKNAGEVFAIYSDNDPYVPIERIDSFKRKLNAETILVKKAGHFARKVKCLKLPQALECVLKIAGQK